MSVSDLARPKSSGALRIVVLGYIVRCPIGGMAWHHLQYVMGLVKLGHEVVFLEDSGDDPWCCYDPVSGTNGTDATYGLEFTSRTFQRIGLDEHWAYHDNFQDCWHGPAANRVKKFCENVEMVINLSGANQLPEYLKEIPRRIYLDTDPLFTQIRILQEPERDNLVTQHNVFFSFGENLGTSSCLVPDDGHIWLPTRQPIDLNAWPVSTISPDARFTTVMQWDSYRTRDYEGKNYGMKSKSFTPYFELPSHTKIKLEIALGSEQAPRSKLEQHGWILRDPLEVTRDPWTYQDYIRSSRGEFSVAKDGYVVARTGWFSERSACYLASGRPVILQDTGFSSNINCEAGLLAFSNFEEALAQLDEVEVNYDKHREAARSIAEDHFDSQVVLDSLVDRAMASQAE